MFPFELMTLCQGKLYFLEDECKTHETWRAAFGFPASLAMNPYVRTFPAGMDLII